MSMNYSAEAQIFVPMAITQWCAVKQNFREPPCVLPIFVQVPHSLLQDLLLKVKPSFPMCTILIVVTTT
jgi:hypothetical protein